MNIEIVEEPVSALPDYGEVPIAFLIKSRYRIEINEKEQCGYSLEEEAVTTPYIKDYDQIKSERPTYWQKRWDVTNWGIFSAIDGSQRVGGAVVAWKTPGLSVLENRDDLAVLRDIRVHPDQRGHGIGSQLFKHAIDWAREKGCKMIEIETQNNNIPACRFYENQGCSLDAVKHNAYTEFPDEIQLLWYLKL